jgi:hypothetical protein
MNKRVTVLVLLLALAGSAIQLPGQTPAAQNAQGDEPLQMIVDYGQGRPPKRRESVHGVVDPVGLPIGQPVNITLMFLRKRAGQKIVVGALDGGTLGLQQPATINADGNVTFQFTPGLTPGLYRLQVNGTGLYELQLYAFDPNAPPRPGSAQ